MLARDLCLFRRFDLSAIPRGKRAQALILEIDRFTPYLKGDHCAVWQGASALVWIWDADRVQAAQREHGLDPAKISVLPEELLYPPHLDGLRLVRGRAGVVGQLWNAGRLLHSRWWPHEPGPAEWLAFQRNASLSPDQQQNTLHPPEPLKLSATPWLRPGGLALEGQALERIILPLGALALALPMGWYGSQIHQLNQATERATVAIAAEQVRAHPILEARREALDAMRRIESLRALDPYPHPLELMAAIAEALPRNGAILTELAVQGNALKITIKAPEPLSGTFLVNALQQRPEFEDVVAQSSNDPKTLTLSMVVQPR